MNKDNVCIVIPARYESSRFPGKPLAKINGQEMIYRVWELCCLALKPSQVFVATDNNSIAKYCSNHGINVVMTSLSCLTGTDRVYDASKQIGKFEYYVNVQGDEPLINPRDIVNTIEYALTYKLPVVNAYFGGISLSEYHSNSVPKVVMRDNQMVYMSRSPIPASKDGDDIDSKCLNKQICIYVFDRESLRKYGEANKKGELETIEDIEILRFIDLGIPVFMHKVDNDTVAVDYPGDIDRVESVLFGFGQ